MKHLATLSLIDLTISDIQLQSAQLFQPSEFHRRSEVYVT